MEMSNISWTAVENLLERFLNEGKRIFIYKATTGDIQLDVDGEMAKEICKCIPAGWFAENFVRLTGCGEADYLVDSIFVRYKGVTYLIQNKFKEIYGNYLYLFFQITQMNVIDIS